MITTALGSARCSCLPCCPIGGGGVALHPGSGHRRHLPDGARRCDVAAGPHQSIDDPVDFRLLLPLTLLMAMVLLVFKVRPDEQDSRASIPVTVLLTLVFLQQTYRDDLPDLPFFTFLDQVYVVAYVVTLLAFVLVIWIGRRYASMEALAEGPDRTKLRQRLEDLDNSWPLVVVAFSGTAIAISWMLIPAGT